jgi:isopentenyl diphosphate isomerase/L-lactate dehydrogenase-like FMN-dependent dehydrogenase
MSSDDQFGSIAGVMAEAQRVTPKHAWDYCAGGAGDESTVHRNVDALDQVRFVPRVLVDVEHPDLTTAVPGGLLTAPMLVAPMGLQGLYHDSAEEATAHAAASLGLGHCLSMFTSRSWESVSAGPQGVRWFQLYRTRSWELTSALLRKAERLGFDAVVLTVDVPQVGSRNRDRDNDFDRFAAAPPALLSDPDLAGHLREAAGGPADLKACLDAVFPNPTAGWADLTAVVAATALPVLVKGVLSGEDAITAVRCGAAGVVVSNHGGRQSDRVVAAADALPAVVAEVGETVPVFFDSGIRRGTHIAAALALGATAVLVGRPTLWGLAAGGQAGACRVLELLREELVTTMRLVGARTPAELPRLLARQPGGELWTRT